MNQKTTVLSFIVGALLAFHSFIQLEGLRYTSSGNSAFITSTNIIFVPCIAFLLFRRKPERGYYSGVLAVVCGFLLINGIVSIQPFTIRVTEMNYGDILTLLCAALTALYFVPFNALTERADDAAVNTFHMIGAAVASWGVWLFSPEKRMHFSDATTVFWVAYCALFASTIGFWLLSKVQTKLSAAKVSVICSLESVFALLFAAVIPGRDGCVEPITLSAAVGGILILAGVIKISIKGSK